MIRSLGRIGSRDSIDLLLATLDHKDFANTARFALQEMTGKDFGTDAARWKEWFNNQKQ